MFGKKLKYALRLNLLKYAKLNIFSVKKLEAPIF